MNHDHRAKDKTTILVVEDDNVIRALLAEFLAHAGYSVLQAQDARTALEILLTEHVDAATIDIRMPDLNGIELASVLREVIPDLRLIAVTAYALGYDYDPSLFNGIVPKPIAVEELQETLFAHAPPGWHRTASTLSPRRLADCLASARREIATLKEKLSAHREAAEPSSDYMVVGQLPSWVEDLLRPIVHDIRNQLYTVRTLVDAVQRYADLIAPGVDPQRFIQTSLPAARQSLDRIDSTLSRLRNLAGRVITQKRPTDINLLIEKVVKRLIVPATQDTRISVELCDYPIVVTGDQELLEQLIENLVVNAIEACQMRPGGVVSIHTQTEPAAKVLTLKVTDNGIGMKSSVLSRIYQLNYTTKETGLGLGLFLAKKAVEEHRGTIVCQTVEGTGTTFIVELPLTAEA